VSRFSKLALIPVILIAPLFSGCSGNGEATVPFKKGGPPPPARCIKLYNKDETALPLGKHAYSPGHGSRAARITAVNEPKYGLARQCLVIYADAESDREYGTLGEFSTDAGWLPMTDYPVSSEQERIALQRSGAESANAKLSPDGTLSPF
jgi:hypothetical protein